MLYLCAKRSIEEVEKAMAGAMSVMLEIKSLEEKIYQATMPEYDDPLI